MNMNSAMNAKMHENADKAAKEVAKAADYAGKKVFGSAVKKTCATVGGKLGGEVGGKAGGLVGTAAAIATAKGVRELPKEGAKAGLGIAVGSGIDFTTKFMVTKATEHAAVATATEAGMAGVRLAAARGAQAAAGGGFASLAGEIGGGFVGKKVGRDLAKRMNKDKDKGGMIGEELGAVSGAAGSGAAFGAIVAGPAGAAGGAFLGIAGYGIGKVVGVAVDKASTFQGVNVVKVNLELGKLSKCEQDEAQACIVTEESPGLGKCFIYFYPSQEEMEKDFKKWWCSRISFTMQDGRLLSELERGGWPWNQANMIASVRHLWVVIIRRPPGMLKWTPFGVAEAEKAGVMAFLGNPVVGTEVTDDQIEAFALASMTAEHFVAMGYIEMLRPDYLWTEFGVATAAEFQVADVLGNPSVGQLLTNEQIAKFADSGSSLADIVRLNYVQEK